MLERTRPDALSIYSRPSGERNALSRREEQ